MRRDGRHVLIAYSLTDMKVDRTLANIAGTLMPVSRIQCSVAEDSCL